MKFFRDVFLGDTYALTASGFVFFGLGVFTLALFGFFSKPFLLLFFAFAFLATFFGLGQIIARRDWTRLALWIVLMVFSASVVLQSEPSVFSGRDQGSIAEAAWRLSQNHELTFETPVSRAFFEIYGPGTALNFPGFNYTEAGSLITQFPLGYTSFLGSFIAFFGLRGFAIANLFLLFLFLWGMFELLSLFVPRFFAVGGTLLSALSFLPVWIAKFSLTENLAAFLFVFFAYCFIRLTREKTISWYWSALGAGILLLFTRIEGFAFFMLFGSYLLFQKETRGMLFEQKWKRVLLPVVFFLFLFLRDFVTNLPFYKTIGKALFKMLHEFSSLGSLPETAGSLGLGSIFFSYGLLLLFLAGIFGIMLLFFRKEYSPLLILFLASPTVLYLFLPSITPDHPWMLRRYYPSLFPMFVFYATLAVFFISQNEKIARLKKPFSFAAFFLLLVFQISPFLTGFSVEDNKGLLSQTLQFSRVFEKQDLILVDRLVTGDPFTMISGPMNFLGEKQAVYFFNPSDLGKLDLAQFGKIYLISPEDSLDLYLGNIENTLLPRETVSFSMVRLIPPEDSLSNPSKADVSSNALLFEIVR